jgi:hypothetical protein
LTRPTDESASWRWLHRRVGELALAVGRQRIELEHRRLERQAAPVGEIGDVRGEPSERHRSLVRFPAELGVGHALEQSPGRRHLMVEFR